MGTSALDFTIRTLSTWHMSVQVAERYREGRIFLVGDAAHRFPPTGGLGLNTGVQDAHNLAWKLAAVEAGWAPAALLDSYDVERRPVAPRERRRERAQRGEDDRGGAGARTRRRRRARRRARGHREPGRALRHARAAARLPVRGRRSRARRQRAPCGRELRPRVRALRPPRRAPAPRLDRARRRARVDARPPPARPLHPDRGPGGRGVDEGRRGASRPPRCTASPSATTSPIRTAPGRRCSASPGRRRAPGAARPARGLAQRARRLEPGRSAARRAVRAASEAERRQKGVTHGSRNRGAARASSAHRVAGWDVPAPAPSRPRASRSW